MKQQGKLREDINLGQALESITIIFGEVASIKLRSLRAAVINNTLFYDDLALVFHLIKLEAQKLNKKPVKNGKILSLILTSNYRFYGFLNLAVVNFYLLQNLKSDAIIIGRTGQQLLPQLSSFIFQNDLPNNLELKQLVTKLIEYEQVIIFYPRFKSTLMQEPAIYDLTAQTNLPIQTNKQLGYILEPEIEIMLKFFDSQMIGVLLERVLLETEISRAASRILAMDEAQLRAKKFIKEKRKALNLWHNSQINKKVLETFAGYFSFKNSIYDKY